MQLDQFRKTYCTQCGAPEPLILKEIYPSRSIDYALVCGQCDCCGADHIYVVRKVKDGDCTRIADWEKGTEVDGAEYTFFAPTLAPLAPTATRNLSAALMRLRMRQVRKRLTPSDMLVLTLMREGLLMLAVLLIGCALFLLANSDFNGGVASLLTAALTLLLYRAQSQYFIREKQKGSGW